MIDVHEFIKDVYGDEIEVEGVDDVLFISIEDSQRNPSSASDAELTLDSAIRLRDAIDLWISTQRATTP